jgi:hypothetical protein
MPIHVREMEFCKIAVDFYTNLSKINRLVEVYVIIYYIIYLLPMNVSVVAFKLVKIQV